MEPCVSCYFRLDQARVKRAATEYHGLQLLDIGLQNICRRGHVHIITVLGQTFNIYKYTSPNLHLPRIIAVPSGTIPEDGRVFTCFYSSSTATHCKKWDYSTFLQATDGIIKMQSPISTPHKRLKSPPIYPFDVINPHALPGSWLPTAKSQQVEQWNQSSTTPSATCKQRTENADNRQPGTVHRRRRSKPGGNKGSRVTMSHPHQAGWNASGSPPVRG